MINGRRIDALDRLPGPVAAAVGEFSGPGFGRDVGGSCRFCRQAGQPEGHPVLEIGKRPVGEAVASLRHLAVGHLVPHQLQQQALGWRGRVDDGPAIATGVEAGPGIEPQPSLGRIAGMAFKAVLNQQRPDPRFKKFLR